MSRSRSEKEEGREQEGSCGCGVPELQESKVAAERAESKAALEAWAITIPL